MLGKIEAGEVMTVPRIDRLARSTLNLCPIVKQIIDVPGQF